LTIIYTQGSYGERFEQTKRCIERVQPHLDHVIIVHDDYSHDQVKWLADHGVKGFHHPWEDNFPLMRNQLLNHARDVDPQSWILTSDPDELFSESLARDIRSVLAEAERNGFNQLGVNSHDIDVKADGSRDEHVSTFFKMLIFKLDAGQVYYVGVGSSKTVHESLCGDWRPTTLPTNYFYEHIKFEHEVWERGMRNFYCGGGGNNVGAVLPNGQRNEPWFSLRAITDGLGLKRWRDVREYMRKGNISPQLRTWLIDHRNWNDVPDLASEVREGFKWYKWLHPEELADLNSTPTSPPTGSWGEVREYVHRCYKEVLGRDSDEAGREFYAQAILGGRIKREDLPNILRESGEYRQRFADANWKKLVVP
jgi:hypothetical protein